MLDTNVAIGLRDGDAKVCAAAATLTDIAIISVVTRIELENGVYRNPVLSAARRARLDDILTTLPTVDFDARHVEIYRQIVEAAGYSRRKLLDRMIATQAIVHQATLVTQNADDFRDCPGLKLLEW